MKVFIFLIFSFSSKGYIQSYWKVGTEGRAGISWIQNTFNIGVHQNIKDRTILYGEVELDYLGFPAVQDFNDLLKQERINPFRIVDREIYVEFPKIFGFIDLKMGDIIEKWGTADTFNPTDNINPYNLEDFVEFGESIPVPGIRIRLPVKNYLTLTGIYIPIFRPAQLPLSSLKSGMEATPLPAALLEDMEFLENLLKVAGMSMDDFISRIEKKPLLPSYSLRNSAYAFKISGLLAGFDLSLSFYHGREDMPLPATGVFNLKNGEGAIFLSYPEINAIGFDTSTSIPEIEVGFWFEGCLFFPASISQEIEVRGFRSYREERLTSPYFKFTTGIDYTFPGGIYLNIQFIRGMFDEMGNEMIKHYIFGGIQDQILSDRVRYRLFGGYTIDDSSFVIYPEVGFMPYEEGEIVLGGYLLEGSKKSKFGQPGAGGDQVFIKFRSYF